MNSLNNITTGCGVAVIALALVAGIFFSEGAPAGTIQMRGHLCSSRNCQAVLSRYRTSSWMSRSAGPFADVATMASYDMVAPESKFSVFKDGSYKFSCNTGSDITEQSCLNVFSTLLLRAVKR